MLSINKSYEREKDGAEEDQKGDRNTSSGGGGENAEGNLRNNKYLSSQGRRVGMGATIPRVRKNLSKSMGYV